MGAFLLAVALLIIGPVSAAIADAQPFHAGISRMTVAATIPFDVLVWYPTQTEEVTWQQNGFPIPASHDAPIAAGRFPIVLLSHGGGSGGGSPLILREIAAYLAHEGFLVVAPFHGNTARALIVRPGQVVRALDAVLADLRFKEHADPARIGMMGFSLGGAITLIVAGAVPNYAHFAAYCGAHADDPMTCGSGPGGSSGTSARQSAAGKDSVITPLPLKAIVLLDPLAALILRDDLTSVTTPVLLYRAAKSTVSAEGNALALAAALPHPPQQEIVQGGHFVFTDSCPPLLRAQAAYVCEDAPGVDRVTIHARVEARIARFFRDSL